MSDVEIRLAGWKQTAALLVHNQRYRVRYRLDNQRRAREFVGTFLGDSTIYTDELYFDLRPDAGTGTLPKRGAIISVEPVGKDVPHRQPRMAKD